MRATTTTAILGLASLSAIIAAPIACSSPCAREYRGVQYRGSLCSHYANSCYQNAQVQPTVKPSDDQVPLLRQVFTTVTRKNDNLNTANANSDKSLNIKYQAGPSFEAKGEASAAEYTKQKGAEHSEDGTSYPIAVVQPSHDVQYSAPVVETKCVEGCSDQDTQYTQPMEDAQCGDNCDDQSTEPMDEAIPVTEDGSSQVIHGENLCGEQVSPCYQEGQLASEPVDDNQLEQDGGDEEDMNVGEGEVKGGDSMEDTTTQPDSSESGMPAFNVVGIQPREALLDNVKAHSSNNADALSNSNQFDQAQVIDQTLYQPKQQQPQIIITEPATRAHGGHQKKYKRSSHKYFKIRYSGGSRY
ncbi:hypothetical protein K493DRAFT_304145 [Basidiobolus meristosporus CBS 931.73]|uniref:CBM1 domain-containing protein n=1 Tax=Basidiobolus meristosporus CBS 931.73 TaxID=1314790 RepID=A0A1Y1XZY7_9FUNG|nr:hypothetical protein K493DRAFT_304145 [Basidiobolus meristosporus CBS 931.73]|eukprot:ORX91330.1 hypothetical protein K493DRAFT_304145 [Basidiobolus meristosporus CBS 931.73]